MLGWLGLQLAPSNLMDKGHLVALYMYAASPTKDKALFPKDFPYSFEYREPRAVPLIYRVSHVLCCGAVLRVAWCLAVSLGGAASCFGPGDYALTLLMHRATSTTTASST